MNERDVPSVPVTTLAGLNSLSDLLSELPVSDTFSNVTPINKSLLFHTLVANESNNLLAVRDENLVRQLVHAIEQTHSDNIEVKPQFAVQQHGTNISTYPELLQGIYNFRPTVFNTLSKQLNFYESRSEDSQQIQKNFLVGGEVQDPKNIGITLKMSAMCTKKQQFLPNKTNCDFKKTELRNTTSSMNLDEINSSITTQLVDPVLSLQTPQNQQHKYLEGEKQPQSQNNLADFHESDQKESITQLKNYSENIEENTEFIFKPTANNVIQQFEKNTQISVLPSMKNTDLPVSYKQNLTNIYHNQIFENSLHSLESQKLKISEQQNQKIEQTQQSNENDCKTLTKELSIVSEQSLQLISSLSPKKDSVEFYFKSLSATDSSPNIPITCSTDRKGELRPIELTDNKPHLRVCINRLKDEDTRLLQQSIKEFVHKSPEIAKKIGLPIVAESFPSPNVPSTNKPKDDSIKTVKSVVKTDTFTMMKADEKRIAEKRKNKVKDELSPEEIFSKPKVRRIERQSVQPLTKSSKEEVLRSQTFQQFMQNIELVIEQLDDTETPNFDSDEIDENIECISPKMLNNLSNAVAKLKAKQVLTSIPENKLTLLINYAMRNVYLAKNYSAGPDDEGDIINDEAIERILNAMEACLLICNIYSTANDLKFLQEDNISVIIKFVQFQFRETIFPSFDPVYTIKSLKKMDNRKKLRNIQNHSRNINLLYSKTVELMKVFLLLFDKCIFVDTIVLPLSTLAIEPFFVDNIEALQFICIELVTTIFRKEQYDKIRSSILMDLLSSIDRLPSSKKSLRPYKLKDGTGFIQMVTALVLQLIQCVTIVVDSANDTKQNKIKTIPQQRIGIDFEADIGQTQNNEQNSDILILKKYDVAVSIGGNFLTTCLNKCKSRSTENDFRPVFENFIHDLLATVNKPEWPASELLLSLLGTMLARYVSDKSIEQSIRLVSLDYLGIVAARLRKDTVESRCKVNIIDCMIQSIKIEQEKDGDILNIENKTNLDPEEERIEFLQKMLLDFLAVTAEEDALWDYARHFYVTQWYRDVIYQRRRITGNEKRYISRKSSSSRKKRRKGRSMVSSESESSSDSDGETKSCNPINKENDQELNIKMFDMLEKRKQYLLDSIKPTCFNNDKNHTIQHIKTYIDYNNAHLIAQYLATKRPFSQSFDGYLKKIILVVNEQSIAVRTRAMKCLANIVEVDPMVLKRKDMQMGVNQKFLDTAISVREAAVDLIGKFVLSNEELIGQYYDMLSTRILDTGVSVRKRVIKILRDICLEYPDFQKIPEICVKMIRRVNDEEGIQKLVTEVFMKMWFTPCRKDDKYGIHRKINQIIDVVNAAHDTSTTWLEGLLSSIFQPKENIIKTDGSVQDPVKKNSEPPQEIVQACQQLADGLVARLIELEDTDNSKMLGCISTLHLLAKVRPQLLVHHIITIEPYLNIKCHPTTAPKFICAVADILEKVVPLVNNASETFLAALEEHLMLLVVSLNQAVVTSCVSCLGALVNKITKNYKLIRDCFQKFYRILDQSRNQVIQSNIKIECIYTPMFRRSLFTIGILMRYFDFKSPEVIGEINGLSCSICDDVFACLMFFVQCNSQDICKQALIALGSFCVMNDDYLTRDELKEFYCDILSSKSNESSIKIICMRNIWIYLTETEMCMYNKEKEWEKQAKSDDLKEMNDVSSGMSSRIIQLYLEDILECFLHSDESVRLWAVKVVQIVLRQGLVHPVRMVPYLICLSTDSKIESAHRADALLKDIDKTYTGFVNMKVQFGLQLCFKLQEILHSKSARSKTYFVIRGYVKRETETMPSALNDFLYTLLRTTKPQRRALLTAVIRQFDDRKTPLRQMLYIADNLAYFSYVVQDEPLYLIHQIDLLVSTAGTNLLSIFKDYLKPNDNIEDLLEDDDDEEDPDCLFKRLPENTNDLQKCIMSAQACMLLLILKEHLKEMYSLTDGKISRYSPSEQKIFEKAVNRKIVPDFNPKTTIDVIIKDKEILNSKDLDSIKHLNDEEKMDLVLKYLDFKKMMLKLDPDDADSEDDREKSKSTTTTTKDSNGTCIDKNYVNDDAKDMEMTSLKIPSSDVNKPVGSTITSSTNPTLRNKRKKRSILSLEEEDVEYIGEDYR